MSEESKLIAQLNDRLRINGIGGRVLLTRGIMELPAHERQKCLDAMRLFSDFNESNDPYLEHDCAIFEVGAHTCMFKIDYYNLDMSGGSEAPQDEAVTARVLTLMLASEY